MAKVGDLFQTADWKSEKHVPVIECADEVKADELFEVKVTMGEEVAHPNTTEHHIRWIHLYSNPKGTSSPTRWGISSSRPTESRWTVPTRDRCTPTTR
jgi:superoxide reductase